MNSYLPSLSQPALAFTAPLSLSSTTLALGWPRAPRVIVPLIIATFFRGTSTLTGGCSTFHFRTSVRCSPTTDVARTLTWMWSGRTGGANGGAGGGAGGGGTGTTNGAVAIHSPVSGSSTPSTAGTVLGSGSPSAIF